MRLPSFQENNRIAVFLLGALAGVAGSWVTVLLVASACWAAVSLVLRRIPFLIARSDLVLLGAATAYFAVNMLLSVGRDLSALGSKDLLSVVIFMSVWLVVPRLRLSGDYDLLNALSLGAAVCGILAAPLAAWQTFMMFARAEGGAGNALPFALICCVFGLLSLLNTRHEKPVRRALGWIGFVSGVACVMMSQSKGLLPVIVVCFLAFLVIFPAVFRGLVTGRGLVALIVAAGIMAASAGPLYYRLESAFTYFTSSEAQVVDQASYTERTALWKHAGNLFLESPVIGHGVHNRRAIIASAGFEYSHFHNGFLTSLVDTGTIGFFALCALLLAPLATALRATRDAVYRDRLYVAVVLLSAYAIGGMTNLIFWQDIYDSVFLWIAMLVSVSVPISRSNPSLGGKGAP